MLTYESEMRKILCKVLDHKNIAAIDIREDLRTVGMDSLNCIELIVALEECFGIEIPDEKLGIQYVHNIYDICKLIEEMRPDEQLQTV